MTPAEFVASIERQAQRVETPCAGGTMPWRIFGAADAPSGDASRAPIVFFHGGSGSWTHWIRNISHFARQTMVVVPDLPGLGDAATLPDPYTVDSTADIVAAGLDRVLPAGGHCDVVGFSWGCTLGTAVCERIGARVRSLLLVGPAAMGPIARSSRLRPLRKRFRGMTEADLRAINRDNLARLMIHDEKRIDDLAVHLQMQNTSRSRFDSPQFARGTRVLDGIAKLALPLKVVYGAYDNIAHEHTEDRRAGVLRARADAAFQIVPDVGHWAAYEWDGFNAMLDAWLSSDRVAGRAKD